MFLPGVSYGNRRHALKLLEITRSTNAFYTILVIAFLSCKLFHNVSLWSLAVEKIFSMFFRSSPVSPFHPRRAFHCNPVYLQQTLPGYLIIALPVLEVVILITLRDNIYFLLCTVCSEHSKCSHSNYQS